MKCVLSIYSLLDCLSRHYTGNQLLQRWCILQVGNRLPIREPSTVNIVVGEGQKRWKKKTEINQADSKTSPEDFQGDVFASLRRPMSILKASWNACSFVFVFFVNLSRVSISRVILLINAPIVALSAVCPAGTRAAGFAAISIYKNWGASKDFVYESGAVTIILFCQNWGLYCCTSVPNSAC